MFRPYRARCPQCGNLYFRDARFKVVCLPCYLEVHRARRIHSEPSSLPLLDRDMLRLLIYLCHPDKHGGSDAANRATAWLLSVREAWEEVQQLDDGAFPGG